MLSDISSNLTGSAAPLFSADAVKAPVFQRYNMKKQKATAFSQKPPQASWHSSAVSQTGGRCLTLCSWDEEVHWKGRWAFTTEKTAWKNKLYLSVKSVAGSSPWRVEGSVMKPSSYGLPALIPFLTVTLYSIPFLPAEKRQRQCRSGPVSSRFLNGSCKLASVKAI